MKQIIKFFKENGYQLWQVGGSIRDELLGLGSNDIDFATNATPEQMIELASGKIDTWCTLNGKAHGTIVFQEDRADYEITTFRKDVSTDGRNATVKFAKTIEEDLSRRDFTINAMAKNMYTGEIVDPFNGQEDLKNKVIRFVGNAEKRVKEDWLRLLRGYRFLSQLGKGWKYLNPIIDISGMDRISKERIREELMKIFKYNPCMALYHMDTNLYHYIFNFFKPREAPDSHGHYHAESLFYHSMIALATAVRLTNDPLLRLSIYLHDTGKYFSKDKNEWGYPIFVRHENKGSEVVGEWMKRMKFSKKETDYVTKLISRHMVQFTLEKGASNRSIKKYVLKLGEELLDDMILLNYCDRTANLAHAKLCSYEAYLKKHTIKLEWLKIKEKDNCFKITDLKVDGHDVMGFGFKGKKVGAVLNKLFEEVENGTLKNERKKLLEKIKIYIWGEK